MRIDADDLLLHAGITFSATSLGKAVAFPLHAFAVTGRDSTSPPERTMFLENMYAGVFFTLLCY
jgi:hypothetical protein